MKKFYLILIIIAALIIAWLAIRFIIGGSEDSWIKDDKGIWIKHGNPSSTPNYVLQQQEIIQDAKRIYENYDGDLSNGPCLGTIEDYAVYVAHFPRQDVDNLPENQCEDYRSGEVSKFIELDEKGNMIRVYD